MDSRSRPAHVGWNLYRDSGYTLSLQDINRALDEGGFKTISERTFTHFERLHRYGFERYVTINQFDVDRLREPVLNAVTRRRYRLQRIDLAATLYLIVNDEPAAVEGTLVAMSESEASFAVEDTKADVSRYEDHVGTIISSARRELPVRVELATPRVGKRRPTLDLSILGFARVDAWTGRPPLPSARLEVQWERFDSDLLSETVRSLYALFESLEAIRIACDSVLALDAHPRSLPLHHVVTISQQSPLNALIDVGVPVAGVLSLYLGLWRRFTTTGADVDLTRSQAESVRADARVKEAVADEMRERTRSTRIQNDFTEWIAQTAQTTELAGAIVREVRGVDGKALSAHEQTQLEQRVRDELLPSLVPLVGEDTKSISVTAPRSKPKLATKKKQS